MAAPVTRRGRVVVVSGPSGVGKTTLCRRLVAELKLARSVSATTRPPRPGEVGGRDYLFLSPEEFRRGVEAGEFLEFVESHGHRYGTPLLPLRERLDEGADILLEIDVRGARAVRKVLTGGIFVFIAPPDEKELLRRLEGRRTEDARHVAMRIARAREEMAAAGEYDRTIVNGDLEKAHGELIAYVTEALGR
ncbi:MAG: guanylate kinase [Planctomycetota bacterium]